MSRKIFLRIALNIIMTTIFMSLFVGCSINKSDLIGKWTGVLEINAKIVEKWVVQFEFFNNGTVKEIFEKHMTDKTISRDIFSGKYNWENNNKIKISWDPPKIDPMRVNYVVKFRNKNTLILENVDYKFDNIEYKRVQ